MKQTFALAFAATVILPLSALAAAAAPGGAETVLWPSDRAVLRAQEDSSIAPLPDGSMGVTTGVKARWPGVRMDFVAGECDLSPYGNVAIAVSNTTEKAMVVNLSVKGGAVQGQTPGGMVVLLPHAAGEIRVSLRNMPWALDAPLELNGMRGHPMAPGTGSTFDLRRTRSFHIFLVQNGTPGGFSVRRVAVSGTGVEQKVLSAKTFLPFVDRYGQFAHDDWPGKVHSDGELAEARAAEAAWLGEHSCPIPDADRYGGWKGGPQLAATGFFRTEKVGGKWWLVDPEGRLFFSHGVDCVSLGASSGVSFRENYFSWLPEKGDPVFGGMWGKVYGPAPHGFYKDPSHLPYETFDFARANAVRKYGADWKRLHAELVHARIRAWGLNTIANWSDSAIYRMRKTPYVVSLGTQGPAIEGSSGWWGKLRDPFAPEFVENIKKRTAAEAKFSGEDPWCVGWFVDNELSWGDDDREIGRAVLRSPAKQPAKVAARAMLERKYGTVDALDAAWGTKYGTWESFLAATNVPNESLCGGDIGEIHRAVVARYFSTVRDAIKAAAPNRLYLGARIAWGRAVVYEESARCCDVVSVNIYSREPSRDLPPGAIDKPMIIGEFHFGALDRGMFHTGLVATRDQDERSECYRGFVNACLDHPRFVGTHWFQWRDQPLTGRFDGENYQIGFVTVTDSPYPELVRAARDIGATMYRRRYGK
ncbi:MAG: beta-galactosidase [Kiritimatiellae bacterium]|nr:beta-galactosidase [Kiritimatiellia bacterium]